VGFGLIRVEAEFSQVLAACERVSADAVGHTSGGELGDQGLALGVSLDADAPPPPLGRRRCESRRR
jgi:hypothetical protein